MGVARPLDTIQEPDEMVEAAILSLTERSAVGLETGS